MLARVCDAVLRYPKGGFSDGSGTRSALVERRRLANSSWSAGSAEALCTARVFLPWARTPSLRMIGVDKEARMHAQVGDELVVDGTEVGIPPRRGKVLEVRGDTGGEHYLVRWSDGHESVFFPSSTAHTFHDGG